jgi:hypothetical protein
MIGSSLLPSALVAATCLPQDFADQLPELTSYLKRRLFGNDRTPADLLWTKGEAEKWAVAHRIIGFSKEELDRAIINSVTLAFTDDSLTRSAQQIMSAGASSINNSSQFSRGLIAPGFLGVCGYRLPTAPTFQGGWLERYARARPRSGVLGVAATSGEVLLLGATTYVALRSSLAFRDIWVGYRPIPGAAATKSLLSTIGTWLSPLSKIRNIAVQYRTDSSASSLYPALSLGL